MSPELWIAFAAACWVIVLIPGPTVLLVVAYALGEGRRTALWTVAGVFLGDLVAMTASVLGLGVLLATSGLLFSALKWAGAAYLVWLGWKLWRAPVEGARVEAKAAATSGRRMLLHAFAVTATNPKGLMFFIAFLPQFVDAARPAAPQLAVMIATFTGIAAVNATGYAFAAGALRDRLASPRALRWLNRGGGGALIAMGAATALINRA